MKQNWSNPNLERLEISKTAGGSVYTEEPDSTTWVLIDGKFNMPLGREIYVSG